MNLAAELYKALMQPHYCSLCDITFTEQPMEDHYKDKHPNQFQCASNTNTIAPEPITGNTRRRDILRQVETCVCKDRQKAYGDAEENFANIAKIINVALKDYLVAPIGPVEVAIIMLCLKLGRIASSPQHLDNWVDTAGYAVCGAGIITKEQNEKKQEDPSQANCTTPA